MSPIKSSGRTRTRVNECQRWSTHVVTARRDKNIFVNVKCHATGELSRINVSSNEIGIRGQYISVITVYRTQESLIVFLRFQMECGLLLFPFVFCCFCLVFLLGFWARNALDQVVMLITQPQGPPRQYAPQPPPQQPQQLRRRHGHGDHI